MAGYDHVVTGTSSDVYADPIVATLVTPEELEKIYAALNRTNLTATVDVTLGNMSETVTGADEVFLVDDTKVVKDALLAVKPGPNNELDNIGQYATYITNNTTQPVYIDGVSDASFVEYLGSGPATISGYNSSVFVADASHATGSIVLDAAEGARGGSYSWLMGGSGATTINGAMSDPTASTLINAGPGLTVINSGVGSATMYGGGATTLNGGSGADQKFYDFTANAHDTLYAGNGGGDLISVAHGANLLDDTKGIGTDSLYAGDGNDTLIGSAAGTHMFTYAGTTDIKSGGGADTISATFASNDTLHIAGYTGAQLQALVDAQNSPTAQNVTLTFTNAASQTVTDTLNNYRDPGGTVHIKFGN